MKQFFSFTQEIIIKFLKESLKYLYENNIIYRDISLDNILLGKNNAIKISDFGLSSKIKEQNKYINNDDNDRNNEEENNHEKILYFNHSRVGRKNFGLS